MDPDGNFYDGRRCFYRPAGYLLMGLLGVMVGAVLVFVLFAVFVLPEIPEKPPAVPEDESLPPPPPLHERDLAVVEVVERVMPSVVVVNRFVTRFGRLVEGGTGSGVIISPDGYILTSQHVIAGADEIRVTLPEAGSFQAELVGEDILTDLALLKINKEDLPYVPLGDSSAVRVGETVLAIGNPLGYFQHTVTSGIVSAVEREIRIPNSQYSFTVIQIDAAISPGNSGGPLINLRGEVIGINSFKVTEYGVEAIGMAIPSNTARRVIKDVKEYGRVRWPRLGIYPENAARVAAVPLDQGVYILEVEPGSAADRSGLRAGDVIVALGDKAVNYAAQLFDALLDYYPGDVTTVTVIRDGEKQEIEITLGER